MAPKDSHFLVFTPSYPEVWPGLIDSFVKIEYGRNDGMSFPKSSDKKTGTSVLGLGSLSDPHLSPWPWGKPAAMWWGSSMKRPMWQGTKLWKYHVSEFGNGCPHPFEPTQLNLQKTPQLWPTAISSETLSQIQPAKLCLVSWHSCKTPWDFQWNAGEAMG